MMEDLSNTGFRIDYHRLCFHHIVGLALFHTDRLIGLYWSQVMQRQVVLHLTGLVACYYLKARRLLWSLVP